MGEAKNIPKLRFPEFEGEWKKYEFGEIAELKKEKYNPVKQNLSYRCIELESLSQETGQLLETFDSLYQKSIKSKFHKGEILFGKLRPYLRKFLKASFDGVCSTEIWVLSGKKVQNEFLYWIIQINTFLNATNVSSGSKMPRADWGYVSSTPIAIPSLPEQQKIASFLTAVDDKIAQLTRKKELLVEYKKGVMQQIFKQEIRFKDANGNAYPDWEEKKLGEVFSRITTKNVENNKNVLTISAQHGLINQQVFFNKSVAAENVTGYYLLEKGDFAYNKSYSKGYPMGATKRLKFYDKGVVSTLYICLRINSKQSPDFYEQYFDSGFINRELHKIAQEGARNHGLLNMSVVEYFNDVIIPNPCLVEQQKIASFLTSIDTKIEQVNTQLEKTKEWKKGLLQKMFV